METEIEEDLLVITWVPESNLLSNDKSVSTNEESSVEEFVGDATFAGQSAGRGNHIYLQINIYIYMFLNKRPRFEYRLT